MSTLLAQLPGYTNIWTPGGGRSTMFDRFYWFFQPNIFGSSLGLLVYRIILFAIILAGLYFFIRLISAGYQYLTSTGDSAKIQAATKELTNAIIGLVVVISSFFLAQILEVVFGINIL